MRQRIHPKKHGFSSTDPSLFSRSEDFILFKLTKDQKENYDITEVCAVCEHASPLRDDEEVLCCHHGVVSAAWRCKKFRYDLLKRTPVRKRSTEPLLTEPLPSLDDDEE